MGVAIAGGSATGLYSSLSRLPDVSVLQYYAPVETTEIYDDKGQLLMKLHDEENRKLIKLAQVPPHVQKAVLAAEDSRFYEHKGVDFIGLGRAVAANLERKALVQGGSTITQQVTKNMFLTPERTPQRKLAEAWLSMKIEERFSKSQILELYLNQVYWGHNAYGIEAASLTYFGKSASQLNLAEGALIAGLLTGPELYSPHRNPEGAKIRQQLTLKRMADNGFITAEEAEQAGKTKLKYASLKAGQMKYPYFTSYVLAKLNENYGTSEVMKGGLKVYTTINSAWQAYAEKALQQHVANIRRMNIEQAALVSVEPNSGFVKVMVGGTSYSKSQFNRAWQAQRQPGSSFKPFVYLAAFQRGYSPAHTEVDEPIQYRFGSYLWRPKNYGGNFSGTMTLQRALETSVNIIAVKLGEKVGNANVMDTAYKLGIRSPLRNVLSLPLGASEVNPLEMASAYATLASGGLYQEPTPILKIIDRFGKVIEDNTHRVPSRAFDAEPVQQLTKVMKGVILRGTAPAANIGRPVAGKTGTTNDHRDAWFVGFSPQLSTAVWIGNDTPTRMAYGATGGTLAATLWGKYMRHVHQYLPVRDFQGPAKGYPGLLAAVGKKKEPGEEDEEKPSYERLATLSARQAAVDANTPTLNDDASIPIDELGPMTLPSSATAPSDNFSTDTGISVPAPITATESTPRREAPAPVEVLPQDPVLATPPPANPRKTTPAAPPKAVDELDGLLQELDRMQLPD